MGQLCIAGCTTAATATCHTAGAFKKLLLAQPTFEVVNQLVLACTAQSK